MKEIEIIEQIAERTENSGYNVRIDYIHGWVTIYLIEDEQIGVFLQGDEASCFISKLNKDFNRLNYITKSTLALAMAWEYIECLD